MIWLMPVSLSPRRLGLRRACQSTKVISLYLAGDHPPGALESPQHVRDHRGRLHASTLGCIDNEEETVEPRENQAISGTEGKSLDAVPPLNSLFMKRGVQLPHG